MRGWWIGLAVAGCTGAGEAGDGAVLLPAVFEADRVVVVPVTTAGDTLRFHTDTGGGANMMYAPAVERLGLRPELVAQGGDTLRLVDWPEWRGSAAVPAPADAGGVVGGRLLVVPVDDRASVVRDEGDAGFLGRLWFADRVWTFDYPARRLLWHPSGAPSVGASAVVVPLGFQTDSAGHRTTHFPRIGVAVDGDSLDLLFDTGATMVLAGEARAALGDGGPARRASSFISARVFDRWRERHPVRRCRAGDELRRRTDRGADHGGRRRGGRARVVRAAGGGHVRGVDVAVDGPAAGGCARRQCAALLPCDRRLPVGPSDLRARRRGRAGGFMTPLALEILLALADGPAHGYAIGKQVEARSGGRLDPTTGALYQALRRLVEAGLVAPAPEAAAPGEDARRRYFRITERGRRAAAEEAARLAALVEAARSKKLYPAPR